MYLAGTPNYEVKLFERWGRSIPKKNMPTNHWTAASDLWFWINKDKWTERQRGGLMMLWNVRSQ